MRRLWLGVLTMAAACGGGSASTHGVEFTPADVVTFDNAVDMIDKPVIVESEWQGQFEKRVARADFIGRVRVDAITLDEDLRGSGYRLNVKVTETMQGRAPRELVLRVNDQEPGFQSVAIHEDRLLGGSFVAFVKWQKDPSSKEEVPRWHLSPNTPAVQDKVRFFLNPPPSDGRTEVEVVAP
ncbi:MAG: hypothetical protein AAF997_21655 [Myxococcota bacterium]